jgi:hypothetical protein
MMKLLGFVSGNTLSHVITHAELTPRHTVANGTGTECELGQEERQRHS